MKVDVIERAHDGLPGRGELQNHEASARGEHAMNLAQRGIEIAHVPHPERDDGSRRALRRQWQFQRVGDDWCHVRLHLVTPFAQHWFGEIGADNPTAKTGLVGERRGHVQRASAQIKISCLRGVLPIQFGNGAASPRAIDVEAEEMVEQIVPRRDRGEDPSYEAAFRRGIRGKERGIFGRDFIDRHRPKLSGASHASKQAVSCTLDDASSRSYFQLRMPTSLDLANLPDADVVALAQAGREPAFRELIRRYERPVFSLIYRMVRDRELAEDLAQDTFIKVLNHIDRYRPEFKLSSWLFKIANNVAIDHLRRRQLDTISMDGSPHASTADAIESTSFEVALPQESALEEMEAKELGSAIEQAIARLRPEYRSCILLRHVEGRSYEEIATTLDLPLGTVKTYIHRARHELRRALEHLKAEG